VCIIYLLLTCVRRCVLWSAWQSLPSVSVNIGRQQRPDTDRLAPWTRAHKTSNRSAKTHTHNTQPFNGCWSGTTRVGWYQKKHSHTNTHPGDRTSFINFLHLLRFIASSVFSLCAWQSSLTTSLQVLFGLPLGLGPSTSYSTHFFIQSSSFRSTCPYQCSLCCCNTNAMSSIHSLSQLLTWESVF